MIAAVAEAGWQWREPAWFWLLALLALLCAWRWQRRAGAWLAAAAFAGGKADAPRLSRSWRARWAGLPAVLELFALVLAVAAVARPIRREPLPPERLGRDVLLCIDRSSSMAATDLGGGRTRLAIGIEAATAFATARADDRIGFVEFARYADVRCPPTLDQAAVRELLGGVTLVAKDGPEDATGIGAAVAAAAAVLQRSAALGKVVVLLTDGEENVATSAAPDEIAPLHAAQLCAQLGIRVHTIVVGLGNQKADGRFVPLDTAAVRQLAEVTRGRFFMARDADTLRSVWSAIDALEVVAFAEPRLLLREGFAALLAAAIALVAVAHVLAHTTLRVVA